MNWIEVSSNSDIPDKIRQDGTPILLEDVDGFVGVGWWDIYNWVLHTPNYTSPELNAITFSKIKRYALLDR